MGPTDGPLHAQDPPSPRRTLADRSARRRDAALAGHRDDPETALTLVSDVDPSVRATAWRALARLGRLDQHHIDDAARDDDASVRRAVAEIVGRLPDDDATRSTRSSTLGRLLDDDDAGVVEMACWAAGEQAAGADHVPRLCELAGRHDEALVREAAVAALGAIGDRAGLPSILAATHDKATVRRRAVIALAPFEGPEVDAALDRARTDRDWQVRQAAEDLSS